MLPDRVSNPGPLTCESGALRIALRGPAKEKEKKRKNLHGKSEKKEVGMHLSDKISHCQMSQKSHFKYAGTVRQGTCLIYNFDTIYRHS